MLLDLLSLEYGQFNPGNYVFQAGSKGKKTNKILYEKFPDFEPQETFEIEYFLLTL